MGPMTGLIAMIMIAMAAFSTYYKVEHDANLNVRLSSTATQATTFNKAADQYIQQYYTNIESVATASTPAVITVPMLQAVNLLPSSFNADPYGQTFQLEVLQPSAGNLQALAMTTGGTALDDKDAAKIASIASTGGYNSGFIPQNDSTIYTSGAAKAYGAFGRWQISTSGYSSVSGGELATLMTYNNGQLVDNRLYRVAVPGQPQLNTMSTALNMGNNNINNAATVNSTTINSTTDNTGTLNASGNANVTGNVAANGNVSGNTLQSNLVASEGASCSGYPSGTIAHDSNGLVLSCQSGVWKSTGNVTNNYSYPTYTYPTYNTYNTGWQSGMWTSCYVWQTSSNPFFPGNSGWSGGYYCMETGVINPRYGVYAYLCCPG